MMKFLVAALVFTGAYAKNCIVSNVGECDVNCGPEFLNPEICESCSDKKICVKGWLQHICCSTIESEHENAKTFLRGEISQAAECFNGGQTEAKCVESLTQRVLDYFACSTQSTYTPIFWSGLRAKACAIKHTDDNQKALEGFSPLARLMDDWSNSAAPLLPSGYHYQNANPPCWRYQGAGQQRGEQFLKGDLVVKIVGKLWAALSKAFAIKAIKTKIVSVQSSPRPSSYFWSLQNGGGELSTLIDQHWKASKDASPTLTVNIHWIATQKTCSTEAPQRNCRFYDQIRDACTQGCAKFVKEWMRKYYDLRSSDFSANGEKTIEFNCLFPASDPDTSCSIGADDTTTTCPAGSIGVGKDGSLRIDVDDKPCGNEFEISMPDECNKPEHTEL